MTLRRSGETLLRSARGWRGSNCQEPPRTAHWLFVRSSSGEDALSFVQFLPAAVYDAGLLSRLAWNLAVRGRWAASYLKPGARWRPRGSAPPL